MESTEPVSRKGNQHHPWPQSEESQSSAPDQQNWPGRPVPLHHVISMRIAGLQCCVPNLLDSKINGEERDLFFFFFFSFSTLKKPLPDPRGPLLSWDQRLLQIVWHSLQQRPDLAAIATLQFSFYMPGPVKATCFTMLHGRVQNSLADD